MTGGMKALKSLVSSGKNKDGQVKLFSWGRNRVGELGLEGNQDTNGEVITDSVKGKSIVDVSCGPTHTLIVTNDGSLYGVGENKHGEVDPNPLIAKKTKSIPLLQHVQMQQPLKKIVQVSCGLNHSAFLTNDGRVFSYGQNEYGQLGHSHDRDPSIVMPRVVEGVPHSILIQVVCGEDSTYMLTKQGKVYACGRGSDGRLGLNNIENQHVAKSVRGPLEGNPVLQIAAGRAHCLAVTVTGRVYGWGSTANGELGYVDDTTGFAKSPIQIRIDVPVHSVSCGDTHSVFLAYNGQLFSCGSGSDGQLGHGEDTLSMPKPTAILFEGDDRIVQAVCGASHTAVLFESGRVSCFGKVEKGNEFIPNTTFNFSDCFRLVAGGDSTFVMRLEGAPADRRLAENKQIGINASDLKTYLKSGKQNGAKIRAAMFDMYSLNSSFLCKLSSGDNNDSSSMVDVEGTISSIQSYVETIKEDDRLKVRKGIASIVAQMDKAAPEVTEPDQLRAYLVLLVSPLMEFAQREHEALIMSIYRLPEKSRELLFQWIETDVPVTSFKRSMVKPLIGHLDKHIEFGKWTGQAVTLCNMLSRLHDMVKGKLVRTEFYTEVPERMEDRQINELYSHWKYANANATDEMDPHSTIDNPEYSLFKYPFLLSANTKRRFMKYEDNQKMHNIIHDLMSRNPFFLGGEIPRFKLEVNRENILNDTIAALLATSQLDLSLPLLVKFQNEDGLDAGGVKKEFFQLLSDELFSIDFGMFREIGNTGQLWFSPNGAGFGKENVEFLQDYLIVGAIIGLAMYNDTLLNVKFPYVMYEMFMGRFPENPQMEDFERFDPETAKQLHYILEIEDEDEMDDLGLAFTVTEEARGKHIVVELKANGGDIEVTKENRHEYVDLYIRYMMYESVKDRMKHLKEGFGWLIPENNPALSLFSPDELELVLVGTPELDFSILKRNAEYEGGYSPSTKIVKTFWRMIESFTYEQKQLFLKFVTGSPRAPVGGLKSVKFKLQRAGPDSKQLPTAHTCFNTLILPDYSSEDKLKKLMQLAIENCEGFGLE